MPSLQPALGSTSTPPPVVVPPAVVPPAPVLLAPVSLADVVAPPEPPWPVLALLPGPALVTWPVVPPIAPVVGPPIEEDETVALLVADVPPLVSELLEALLLEPTALELVLLVSEVVEVVELPPAADGGPSLSSELQPKCQPTRARSAGDARKTRRVASAG